MATGDDAAAGGMDLVPGTLPANEIDTAINQSRDYIANGPTHWKPGVTLPVSKLGTGVLPVPNGGTGADDAAEARANLGIIAANIPTSGNNVQADIDYVNGRASTAIASAASKLPLTGGDINGNLGVTGHIYTPNAFAASSGYVVAYINGDGRLSRGASGAQFKEEITPLDPLSLGDLFPPFYSFIMKDDPGRMVRYGNIAQDLDASDALRPFVVYARESVYEQLEVLDDEGNVIGHQQGAVIGSTRVRDADGNPIPESIDFIALLLAQVAQLNARVTELEARP